MIGAFPHQVTGVIPSSVNLHDCRVIGKPWTYTQKNEKLTVVRDQGQGARPRFVVYAVGVKNKAPI
jgi:hypothetical protein